MPKFIEVRTEDFLATTKDAERWRFLVKHWSSIYKGKPLWRYIEEDGLRAGGIEAILDDAMSVVTLGGGK